MRRVFEYTGLFTLMCFSFFITEKTSTIAKNTDNIMLTIKNEYANYETLAVDAKIDGDRIIPGICGRKVNINDSYNKMKKIGLYDDSLYQYNYDVPKISSLNIYDKYIQSDNLASNAVYLFVKLNNSNQKFVEKYDFKNYNFIVDSAFFEENKGLIKRLLKNNSIVIAKTSFKDYKKIDKLYLESKGSHIYCYNDDKNNEFLLNCSSNKSSTIGGVKEISEQYLLNVKKQIGNGRFIGLELTSALINNIKLIEDYIASKGMNISQIDISLKEC